MTSKRAVTRHFLLVTALGRVVTLSPGHSLNTKDFHSPNRLDGKLSKEDQVSWLKVMAVAAATRG